MPDRETSPDKGASGGTTPKQANDRTPQDPDLGQQNDPESQKSTTSRPRGHTEEPDRTL